MSAESIRVMCPLFQAGEGGSIPTSALSLAVERVNFREAQQLNKLWHSRLPMIPDHCKWLCYAATHAGLAYAVAIWSRPVAQALNDRPWLELRRLAIAPDAPKNTASRMLAVMARLVAKERPDITTLISYQDMDVHKGTIYKAAGWQAVHVSNHGEWNRAAKGTGDGLQSARSIERATGKRVRKPAVAGGKKVRWEKVIREAAAA